MVNPQTTMADSTYPYAPDDQISGIRFSAPYEIPRNIYGDWERFKYSVATNDKRNIRKFHDELEKQGYKIRFIRGAYKLTPVQAYQPTQVQRTTVSRPITQTNS